MRNLLIFILLLVGVWWIRRAFERYTQSKRRQAQDMHNAEQPQARLTERVVACEHCGLHVPESEGVHAGEHFFCCDEHRRLGVRDVSGDN